MHRHLPVPRLRMAGYVAGGALLVLATTCLEALAGWKLRDILQSMGAAAAILILAVIRSTARREARDKLWVTALWHVLIAALARTMAWIHAHQGEGEAPPDTLAAPTDATEARPSRTAEARAATAGTAAAHPADDADGGPAVVERHGPWVKREKTLLFTREDPLPGSRRRGDGAEDG